MKKLQVLIISLIMGFSVLLNVVWAHDETGDSGEVHERLEALREKRQEIREEYRQKLRETGEKRRIDRDRLSEKRGQLRDKSASRTAEFKNKAISRIKEIFAKILNRHEAALARLDKIADKIAARIDKLNDKGVNTQAAQTQLVEAEALGAVAQTAIDNAQAQVEAIDQNSQNVRDTVLLAKEAMTSSKQALANYHKALVEAIRELKASRNLREATGEAENEND